LIDNGIIDLDDDDDGIDATPSEDPAPGSSLSSFPIVIDLEYEDGIDETPSEPDDVDAIFEITSEPPGLIGSASIVLDEIKSEPHGLGSIPDEPIVIETLSEPPGLGLIPSEPQHLFTSIGINLDDDDGIFEISSEPPGLGSASIVVATDDNDGVDATWSEPFHDKDSVTTPGEQFKKISRLPALGIMPVSLPSEPSDGLGSRLSSLIDDSHELAFFGPDDEHGIHVVTEDSIAIESSRLGSRLSSLDGNLLEHDHGITPVSIPSDVVTDDSIPRERPDGIRSHLSSSIGDSHGLAFFGLDAEHGIHVVTEDSISSDPEATMDPLDGENLPQYQVQPSEPSRLNDEHGIQVTTNDLISSENPIKPCCCLSSRFSSLDGDLFEHDHGITPVSSPSEPSADDLIEQSATKLEMGRLHAFDLIEQSATKMEMGRLHEYDTPSH
jgi:hypothetical protein